MDRVSRRYRDIEIVDDEQFDYTGYQIVRGEFFAHTFEPAIVFNKGKVSVNSACLRKLPETEFVQILVNPEQRKLAVLPSKEEEKDSFRWKTSGKKVSPKQVTCKVFFAKIYALMGWNLDYRYKLLGKLIRSNGELLFVFNLNNPEIYIRVFREGEKPRVSRTPVYPQEWKNQFGISVEEHRKSLSMNKFNEYTIFGVRETATKGEPDISNRKEDVNNESE